jgi:hypothetical protein
VKRLILYTAILAALAACVRDPKVRVVDVALTQQTPEGGRVEMLLTLRNPNSIPLPLVDARYRVSLKGTKTFAVTENLRTTLPPKATQTLKLTASFPGQPLIGRDFSLSGKIAYRPPPTLLEKLLEESLPLPKAGFHRSGTLVAAAPATQPAP